LNSIEKTKLLIENNFSILPTDEFGENILHYSIKNNNNEITQYILEQKDSIYLQFCRESKNLKIPLLINNNLNEKVINLFNIETFYLKDIYDKNFFDYHFDYFNNLNEKIEESDDFIKKIYNEFLKYKKEKNNYINIKKYFQLASDLHIESYKKDTDLNFLIEPKAPYLLLLGNK
jgi:hypothetical protein